MQRLARGFNRKGPVVVGHLHPVAQNRVGNGDRGMADGRIADTAQVFANGVYHGVVIVARQHFYFFDLLRRGFQRKAGIGATDIGHQARP